MPNNRAPMPTETVPTVRRTPAIRRTLAVACTAAAAGVVLYLLDATTGLPGGDRLYDAWIYCGVLLLSGAVIGLRAAHVAVERPAWILLAVCHVTQVGGWIVYWPLAEPGPNPPHPPAADALWMLSYILALAALFLLVRARAVRFDRALPEEARWILHHHERLDGRGYPRGLRGDEIPLESRIILVADAFEAMTSDRPYRRSAAAAAALEELNRHAGTQFDPDCVAALERALTRSREPVAV